MMLVFDSQSVPCSIEVHVYDCKTMFSLSVKFDVFSVMSVRIVVFWGVTLRSLQSGYKWSGETHSYLYVGYVIIKDHL
jgi:hypothetical protein